MEARGRSPSAVKEPSATPHLRSQPRRLSEIWKLDRATGRVVALGLDGTASLNRVGSSVWMRLDGRHAIEGIVDELVEAYGEQHRQRIRDDVRAFISELVAQRLVVLDFSPL